MSEEVKPRDQQFAWVIDRLLEIAKRPSSFSADSIRNQLVSASGLLRTALIDLKGWENESRAQPVGWRKSKDDAPPEDGSPFWAWLYDTGIRKMRWKSAEEVADEWGDLPEECEGRYCTTDASADEWEPDYWLPLNAIPAPPEGEAERHG